jgi:hypothetical protein
MKLSFLLAVTLSGACLLASAATTNIYVEDWGSTKGGTNASFSNIGWKFVVPAANNPPYEGIYQAGGASDSASGATLPVNTLYYTGLVAGQSVMFYTTDSSGAGSEGDSAFADIDPTQYTGLTLSVEASDEGTTASNFFAVQVGGAWYVSTTALAGSDPKYPAFTSAGMPYTNAASAWNKLTINANSVTVGSAASGNLSGPITGIGIVQVGTGGWNYNQLAISAVTSGPAAAPPVATIYGEDWGTATFNSGGAQAGALTDVGWSSSGIAYTGMYSAPGSIDPGTGVTFPPPPIGNIGGTNNALYASMDAASAIGIFYTTDTNGSGADGTSSFVDINPGD